MPYQLGKPGVLVRLLAVAVSALCAMGVFELVLRVTQPATQNPQYVPDAVVGYRLAPSQRIAVADRHGEYKNVFVVNEAGAPDRKHSIEKPDATFRIAFIGDSMTAGKEVARNRRFPAVVEQVLNEDLNASFKSTGLTVESLNFGTPGYGTAQELLDYQTRVRHYGPDLVVIGFLPDNDIRNNSYTLEIQRARRDAIAPFFEAIDGRLKPVPIDFYRNAQDKHSSRREESWKTLRTVAVARSVITRRFRDPVGNTVSNHEYELDVARELFDPAKQRTDPAWQSAWETTALLLKQFRSKVAADGAGLHIAVLTGPCALQATCRSILQSGQSDRKLDWSLPHVMSRQMLAADGFAFSLLVEALQRERDGESGQVHFPRDGHYTELGHRLVGEYLAAELRQYVAASGSSAVEK